MDQLTNLINQFNQIIYTIENRCMAADGPVTPTLQEASEDELSKLWHLLQEVREFNKSPRYTKEEVIAAVRKELAKTKLNGLTDDDFTCMGMIACALTPQGKRGGRRSPGRE